MSMKHFIVTIFLLASTICGAGVERGDLEAKRHYYQNLFTVDPKNVDTIAQFLESLTQYDEGMHQHIREAVALNDDVINRGLIAYIYWRAVPFSAHWPFTKPDQGLFDKLRMIEGLKSFLLTHLDDRKPHFRIFEVISNLYRNDEEVIDKLIEMASKNELLLGKVLNGLVAAGLYSEKIAPLALKAISSDDKNLISVALDYLRQSPLPDALPHLIHNLQRPDSDWDRVYIPPDIEAITDAGHADKEVYIGSPWDGWRFGVVAALLAYDKNELAAFSDDIFNAKNKVTFGPISQGHYEFLVRELKALQADRKDFIK